MHVHIIYTNRIDKYNAVGSTCQVKFDSNDVNITYDHKQYDKFPHCELFSKEKQTSQLSALYTL